MHDFFSFRGAWRFIALALFLSAVPSRGQTYEVVHAFRAEYGDPQASLVRGTDGRLYGTTTQGGSSGAGSLFALTPDGTGGFSYATLHEFHVDDGAAPVGALIQGSDGNFYGTAEEGGAYSKGTAFRMDASGQFTVLHSFAGGPGDGAYPHAALIQAADGNFYGTTPSGGSSDIGTVFKMDSLGTVTILHSFAGEPHEGRSSYAPLIQGADGNFYGTTFAGGLGNGTVFKMDALGQMVVLHSFSDPSEGTFPLTALIQASDGSFYGATQTTIFKIDASGILTTLYTFIGYEGTTPNALIQATDGNFYGTATYGGPYNGSGTVFRMDASGNLTPLHFFCGSDGAQPSAGLIQGNDGAFYGTTSYGGPSNRGTVFRMDSSGSLTTLYAFPGGDGSNPNGVIQAADGNFYGTTTYDAMNGKGTAFRMDGSGHTTTLHVFSGLEGSSPSSLIQARDGEFYGTTLTGGDTDRGTIFKMDDFGNLTTLRSLSLDDPIGYHPYTSLIQAADGSLCGTNGHGGPSYGGTAYRLDGAGNVIAFHGFGGYDGQDPEGALLQASDGSFYGTTSAGGAGNAGALFRMDPAGAVTTLHSFTGSDGSEPLAALIQGADGNLYGTTRQGGNGFGTVFRADTSGNVTTLHRFGGPDGARPSAALVPGPDGSLYGTTAGGGSNDYGTIFRLDSSGVLTTLHFFDGTDGAQPSGDLIRAADGNLYGTTFAGGPSGGGVLFRVTLPSCLAPVAGNDGPVCEGQTIHLTATTAHGAAYSWTGPNGFVSNDQNPSIPNAASAASGLYRVTVILGDCAPSATTTVTVRPSPTAAASGTATIAPGGSTPLTGSGGVSCSWSPAAGLSNPSSCTPAASPSVTTTYTLTVTDANGCVSTNNPMVTVTVLAPTTTAIASSVDPSAAGQSVTFTATVASASGTPTGSVTFKDGAVSFESVVLSAGAAAYSTSALSLGSHAITAVYAGDGSFGGSISPPLTQSVLAAPKLTVTKVVVNDNGGTKQVSDFPLFVDGTPVISGIQNSFPSGPHTINETSSPGYSATISGDCAADGSITLNPGDVKVCTITNNDISLDGYEVLHSFFAGSEGAGPNGALIQAADGSFYGTTDHGGSSNAGTVYKIDAAGSLTTLHAFTTSDGSNPQSGLIQATDGKFYGTTLAGGPISYHGTVFRMDSSGIITTLHSFLGADGASPSGGLIQATDGNLYGTTAGGGTRGYGTVFRMDTSGNFTTLHSFAFSDGANPGTLLQAADGSFYGTTVTGGAGGLGTVFRMDAAGNVTTLHSFAGYDGTHPFARLIQATDGNFYGTTLESDSYRGTAFKFDASGNFTTLHNFWDSEGAYPHGGLTLATDGVLYGTAQTGGANGAGTVFRLDASGNLAVVHSFNYGGGSYPLGVLLQAADGSLYGTTSDGGASAAGVVFRLAISACPPPPVVANNTPLCGGQTLRLTAGGAIGATYSWTGPNGFTSSLPNPIIPNVTAAASGDYTVTVTFGSCAPSAATTTATVLAPPTAVASGSATIAPGFSTPLTGSGGLRCYWSPPAGLSSSTSCTPTASPSITTTYTLLVTDANGCFSTNSPTVTVTVATPTTTTVSSSANPSAVGQSLTFTATVTSGSGTPTGTVTFKDGATPLGSAALSAGGATYSTAALTLGSHSITAVYAGEGGFGDSVSTPLAQSVLAAPRLTVTKIVVNDNGGTKAVGDFPLFVDATTVTSGVQGTFNVGTHTVSETSSAGYAATFGGACASNGSIALAPGDIKSCTITNNDIAPKLTVTKVVVNDNGGTKQVANFPLFVDGTAVVSGAQNTFTAGAHTVTETSSPGYAATFSGDCASNGSITLALGDVKSCTLTNNDIAPRLTVTKVVVNNNGGTKTVADFPLFVDATRVTSGVQNTFNAGAHILSETSSPGYAATFSGDCAANGSITLNPADVKNCTITNDDFPLPDLTVSAFSVPATGGANLPISVTDTAKNQGSAPAAASTTRFYLSTDSALSADDVLLGSRNVAALNPNATSSGSTTLTIPAGTPVGAYFVIAMTDAASLVAESNESNNTRTSPISLSPDLIVSAISAPASAKINKAFSVSDTTKNQGQGSAAATTTTLYLSTDATWDPTDLVLRNRAVPILASGANNNGSGSVTIPSGTRTGSYYLIARADATGAVAETNESNNTMSKAITIAP